MYTAAWEANGPDYHQKRKRNKRVKIDQTMDQSVFDQDMKFHSQEKQRNVAIIAEGRGSPDREKLALSRKERGGESGFQDRIRKRNEEMRRFLS